MPFTQLATLLLPPSTAAADGTGPASPAGSRKEVSVRYQQLRGKELQQLKSLFEEKSPGNFVHFGVVQPAGGPYVRAIHMRNLLTYRVVIIARCRNPMFQLPKKFLEIGKKGKGYLAVTLNPPAGAWGLQRASLELFWQDNSRTVFQLLAFVGQPLEIDLVPDPVFPPSTVQAPPVTFTAEAINHCPYPVKWKLAPFGSSSDALESTSFAARAKKTISTVPGGVRKNRQTSELTCDVHIAGLG